MYVYVLIPKHWDTMWGDPVVVASKKKAEEIASQPVDGNVNVHYEIYKCYLKK